MQASKSVKPPVKPPGGVSSSPSSSSSSASHPRELSLVTQEKAANESRNLIVENNNDSDRDHDHDNDNDNDIDDDEDGICSANPNELTVKKEKPDEALMNPKSNNNNSNSSINNSTLNKASFQAEFQICSQPCEPNPSQYQNRSSSSSQNGSRKRCAGSLNKAFY